MRYAIDPELAPWVSMLPCIDLIDAAESRKRCAELVAGAAKHEPSVPVTSRDLVVPGESNVPVRVYAPLDRPQVLPGLVYFHGGGFVTGDVPMFDEDCARIAADVDVVVVSVEYRLAPEHTFPAGVEDCYAALCWTAAGAAELGIAPDQIGVGGESTGGGLAAAVALLARDRHGPPLCFQWLGTAELDDRLETPSMHAFTDPRFFDRAKAERSWDHYLGPGVRGGADVSPYAAPSRCADLSGLPRAYVVTCEFDPMRDEGLAYALRLIQAGVPTEIHHYPGTFHGSHMIPSAISDRMIADQAEALRRGLHT
jgi:acetyl esterase